MKRWLSHIGAALPHLAIALALAVGTLVVLEYFNPRMGFLTSAYSMVVIFLLAVTALAAGIRSAARDRREQKNKSDEKPGQHPD